MKILVANLGSTSFKYRLFDMADERVMARGGVERIGSDRARGFVQAAYSRYEETVQAPDHAAAVRLCLRQLSEPQLRCLSDPGDLSAIAFKAVHAQGFTSTHRVDDKVLDAMEAFADVAPAHNPPYVAAMRLLAREFPDLPLVAAFETGFHDTIPPAEYLYAVPLEWAERYGIRRWGFHGASHRYIAERTAALLENPSAKIVSCHLGGSSSVCAIRAGRSVATSMGMSPQSGLPNNNRVGDFDPFALPVLMRATGKALPEILDDLANRSGLAGLSGAGRDLRDVEAAMAAGDRRARQALDVFISSVRHYLGAYFVVLKSVDAIVFTGGIGENSAAIRSAVCADLSWFGIRIDPEKNLQASGEMAIHRPGSRVQIWTMPTNEELIVARQAKEFLEKKSSEAVVGVSDVPG